ncbi:MAG TPA: hypothetical protein VK797_08015 [Tepidisphaeraceae bacterium]|nr:hypothetical protein [Tepidisphaeraceae bacterium]
MRREFVLVVAVTLSFTSGSWGADRTIGGTPLGDRLHIRRRARSLAALVRQTRPTFVWADGDMIWVERGEHGRPQFALNRVYQLDGAAESGGWVLLESQSDYVASGVVDFMRENTGGQELSRDTRFGAVYLVVWHARHITGTGPVDCERHILLLCDRKNQWHFVAEGLGAIDGHASSKRIRTESSYKVTWTAEGDAPLAIAATRSTFITAHNVERDDTTTFESERDFALTGKNPGSFAPTSDDYTITSAGDTRQVLSLRLAICDTFYPYERDARRKARMLQSVADAIATLNPQLPRRPAPGTHVILPDLESVWDAARSAAGPRKASRTEFAQVSDD